MRSHLSAAHLVARQIYAKAHAPTGMGKADLCRRTCCHRAIVISNVLNSLERPSTAWVAVPSACGIGSGVDMLLDAILMCVSNSRVAPSASVLQSGSKPSSASPSRDTPSSDRSSGAVRDSRGAAGSPSWAAYPVSFAICTESCLLRDGEAADPSERSLSSLSTCCDCNKQILHKKRMTTEVYGASGSHHTPR